MLVLEIGIYLALFTIAIRLTAFHGGIDALYFYPKACQEKVFASGQADPSVIQRRAILFYICLFALMFGWPIFCIRILNHVDRFYTAYFQSVLFLEILNWYDGLAVDQLWVRFSPLWKIPALEDMTYVRPLKSTLIRRSLASILYLAIAAILAL